MIARDQSKISENTHALPQGSSNSDHDAAQDGDEDNRQKSHLVDQALNSWKHAVFHERQRKQDSPAKQKFFQQKDPDNRRHRRNKSELKRFIGTSPMRPEHSEVRPITLSFGCEAKN